jgi:serine/threonine-protein kinase
VIGRTLSRYRITGLLGSGGVGDVYRADDLRLRRPVALKLVRGTNGARETAYRLLAEARAASALSHPNIAVVYEVDEVQQDGQAVGFIAMEYVAGRTLAALAAEGLLPVDRVLDIGRQIAEALAHAHRRGVVHKDIKPSNVMVTDGGLVKVLDFGVARQTPPVADARVDGGTTTESAVLSAPIVGTLPYMSPEQATGRELDGRSDMFSLGVVLYELLEGRRPFEGATVARLLEALLLHDPAPIAPGDDERRTAAEGVVRRMLEKDPSARFDDLSDVAAALANVRRRDRPAMPSTGGAARLAIAPFQNITANADDEWLGTGIAEALIADLAGLEGIDVLPGSRVHAALRTLARPTGQLDDAAVVRAGRELGARWMLTGGFQRAGDSLRVTAAVRDLSSQESTRTIKADGRLSEVFALQDRLATEVADALRGVTMPGGGTAPDTEVVSAYEALSRGVLNIRTDTHESLERAILLFERAVALDPLYARAHLELGAAYATKADYLSVAELRPKAVAALRRALELTPDSVRALRELGGVLIAMGREAEGFEAIDRALALDPHDAGALGAKARGLFLGRAQFAEAAIWYEHALAANPNAGWYALQLAHCAAFLRDFARGEAAARRAIDLQIAALSGQEGVRIVGASLRLGHLDALQGRHQSAIARFTQELDLLAQTDHALRSRVLVELDVRLGASYLGIGEARKGRSLLETAVDAFERRVRLGADEPFTRYYAAAAYALLGDADTAVEFLARAAAERRAFTLARARIEPEFEALRADPRLQRLLASG